MADHNELGKKGEEIAAEYLAKIGFSIKHRNWRFAKDEIDIIAETDDYIVFVEVKTRSNIIFGEPDEAVTKKKQKFLIRAANEYIIQNNYTKEARFDIISVILSDGQEKITHLVDAFYPTL